MRLVPLVSLLVVCAGSAHAAEPVTVMRAPEAYGSRARLLVEAGLSAGSHVRADVAARVRVGPMTLGLGVASQLDYDNVGAEDLIVLVGGGFDVSERWRFEGIAEIGYRWAETSRFDGGFMSWSGTTTDPGTDYERAVLGLRVGFDWRWSAGGGAVLGFLGLSAYVRGELGPTEEIAYTWEACELFGPCEPMSTTAHVGGRVDAGVMLRIGVDFGL